MKNGLENNIQKGIIEKFIVKTQPEFSRSLLNTALPSTSHKN